MHPIERLRYVARAEGASQGSVVSEAARALSVIADDPAELVMAARQLVAHQATFGAMWWMAARVLASNAPGNEAFTLSEELEDDTTARMLARALDPEATVLTLGWPPQVGEALAIRGSGRVLIVDTGRESSGLHRQLDHRGVEADLVPLTGLAAAVAASDAVVIECLAGGPDVALFGSVSAAAAAVAHVANVPVTAAVGVGRMLPQRLWDALITRWELLDEPWELAEDLLEWSLVDHVVSTDGAVAVDRVRTLISAPITPELLKP